MFRNMVTSLFKHDRIRTTEAKAKEVRRWADQLVTLAKRGDLHARRQALAIIREKDVVHKLFEEAQDRFGAVKGGYTRVVKLGFRAGDAAPLSLVELITPDTQKKKKKKKKKPKVAVEPSAAAVAAQSPEATADAAEAKTPPPEPPVETPEAEAVEAAPEGEAQSGTPTEPSPADAAVEAPADDIPEKKGD